MWISSVSFHFDNVATRKCKITCEVHTVTYVIFLRAALTDSNRSEKAKKSISESLVSGSCRFQHSRDGGDEEDCAGKTG